jgi:purine-nucleoside phosphorylase
MPASGAPGHRGAVIYGTLGGKNVLVFSGRSHYYEGYALWQVSFSMRIMQALGVPRALVTAASGGLADHLETGDLMLVTDHLNFLPDHPLRGISDPRLGERFVAMSNAYDEEWGQSLIDSATDLGIQLRSGVYACVPGPSLETQAECRWLRDAGAHVVGMSIVPEVIVGVQAGIRMAAIATVANMAWHPGGEDASVPEILAASARAAEHVKTLLHSLPERRI